MLIYFLLKFDFSYKNKQMLDVIIGLGGLATFTYFQVREMEISKIWKLIFEIEKKINWLEETHNQLLIDTRKKIFFNSKKDFYHLSKDFSDKQFKLNLKRFKLFKKSFKNINKNLDGLGIPFPRKVPA